MVPCGVDDVHWSITQQYIIVQGGQHERALLVYRLKLSVCSEEGTSDRLHTRAATYGSSPMGVANRRADDLLVGMLTRVVPTIRTKNALSAASQLLTRATHPHGDLISQALRRHHTVSAELLNTRTRSPLTPYIVTVRKCRR